MKRFVTRKQACLLLTFILAITGSRMLVGQTTVAYTDPSWRDFGTTNITGVTGNFLPGWEQTQGSPDIGNNLFFYPTDSLSGAPDDAALWMLRFTNGSPANEAARLSLNGFTPGTTYVMDFWATVTRSNPSGWVGDDVPLDVNLTGADISAFATSHLLDPVAGDGMNDWTFHTLEFEALSSNVTFEFNGIPTTVSPLGDVSRIAVDGFEKIRITSVPEPASFLVLAAATCFASTCRRRPRTHAART